MPQYDDRIHESHMHPQNISAELKKDKHRQGDLELLSHVHITHHRVQGPILTKTSSQETCCFNTSFVVLILVSIL